MYINDNWESPDFEIDEEFLELLDEGYSPQEVYQMQLDAQQFEIDKWEDIKQRF